MKKFRFAFILLFLIAVSFSAKSQCNLNLNTKIKDIDNSSADTTNISILVGGAVNNNLATAAQGLCGVSLKFKHPFVKELFIELISPSGQKIRLVGGDITSYFTDLITWDVTFVPCISLPSPDPGFLPKWENDQDWVQLTTYTGQYHPHQGCLADFNTGTVNGTWTLRCIDNVDGGEGIIQAASLVFCQSTGVMCSPCKIDPGVINNADGVYCKNDPQLNLNIQKVFPVHPMETTTNSYKNVVFKDGRIFEYKSDGDFSTFTSGTYTICGSQYITAEEATILPAVGTLHSPKSLNEFFFIKGACAAVSDSCMKIVIVDQKPINKITKYICSGSSYPLNGINYSTTGIYTATISVGACDSIVELDLRVISIPVNIKSDRDFISCQANRNAIYIEPQPNNLTYEWYTLGGEIGTGSNIKDFGIDATKPGDYCVKLTYAANGETCLDTLCKTILPDFTFPELTFDFDTLNCSNGQSTNINISSSLTLSSASWLSREANPFTNVGAFDINVTSPGTYVVNVREINGCSVVDSVTIVIDTIFKAPIFTSNEITCFQDTSFIDLELDSSRNYSIDWVSIDTDAKGRRFVTVPNTYNVVIRDIKNGCGGDFTFQVIGNTAKPEISITTDTLDCLTSVVKPSIMTNADSIDFAWNINGTISNENSPNITDPGSYSVTITDKSNGCENSENFEILKDITIPTLSFNVDSLTCIKDSVQLNYTSSSPIATYNWSALEFGFSSTDANPYVKISGTYKVDFVAENGCIGSETIFVNKSREIPETSIVMEPFKCGLSDTLEVKILFEKDAYVYEWSGPSLSATDIPNPKYWVGGEYEVLITNPASGCKDRKKIVAVDDRIYSDPMLSADELDCDQNMVTIKIGNADIVSALFDGPTGSLSGLNPSVSVEGAYYGQFTNTKNCISFDTIIIKTNADRPVISIDIPPILCGTTSVQATTSSSIAGTTYSIRTSSNGLSSTNIITVNKGDLFVKVIGTAPNGCIDSISKAVVYDTLPTPFSIINVLPLICKDSLRELKTNFTSVGTTTWLPSGNISPTLVVNEPGTYIAVITKSNNCITSDTIEVIEQKNFPTFTTSSTVINCEEMLSEIDVKITSPFKALRWQSSNPEAIPNGTIKFETSFTGQFGFEVENDEGCISKGIIEVKADLEKPKINRIFSDTIDCINRNVTLGFITEKSINSVIWNGPSPVFDVKTDSIIQVSKKGQYYATIIGENFCRKDTFINVYENLNLPIFSSFTDTLTCDKGKVTIGVITNNPLNTYTWSGPNLFTSMSKTPIVFNPGAYLLTVTADNGCQVFDTIIVGENFQRPKITIAEKFYIPCDSSGVSLIATFNEEISRYKWVFPDGTINSESSPITAITGFYQLQVAGQNGCLSLADTFEVIVNTAPPGFSFESDTINCKTPIVTLKATSPDSDIIYKWTSLVNPSNVSSTSTIQAPSPGIYQLIVSNSRNCRDTIEIDVPIDTVSARINFLVTGKIECAVTDVIIDASNSLIQSESTIIWSNNGGNIAEKISPLIIKVNQAGKYNLSITNNRNGCKSSASYEVMVNPQSFTVLEIETLAPSCDLIKDGKLAIVDINGTPPFKISINGSSPTTLLSFDNLDPGNYLIEVTDSLGCFQSKNAVIDPSSDLNFDVDKEFIVQFGDSITIIPEFIGNIPTNANVTWIARGDTLCANCQELTVRPFVNTVYEIIYATGPFCFEKATVLVRVINKLNEIIPNIFAPSSGNLSNSFFYIKDNPSISEIVDVKVFGSWAECVYHGKNLTPGEVTQGWDGRFKGKDVREGVYIVVINLKLADGSDYTYRGDLTLIR